MAENLSRSPIKLPSLRHPGQSLDEQIDDLANDKLLFPMMLATMLIVFAAYDWWAWYQATIPNPILMTGAALLVVIWSVWRVLALRKQLRSLRQARAGERAVGQELDKLVAMQGRVFHDILGPNFNVDHVFVAPQGVFAIETKTWSLPEGRAANIDIEGDALVAAGYPPERDPLRQCLAQARWVQEVLKRSAGRDFPVRGVLLFPGWFVEPRALGYAKTKGAWILNPKALPSFLEHEHPVLSPEDVSLASFHLSRFIRTGGDRLQDA